MNKQQQVAIPKTSVIELRQQNKNALVHDNGDFSINLDEQLVIEEGDSIQLKSVYLDTGSVESGFINLPPDTTQADPSNPVTTITITVGKYLMNIPSSQEGEFYTTNVADLGDGTGTGNDPAANSPGKPVVQSKIYNPKSTDGDEQANGFSERLRMKADGKPYVMCSQTKNSGAADTQFILDSISLRIVGGMASLKSQEFQFELTYALPNMPVSANNRGKKDFDINVGNAEDDQKGRTQAQVQADFAKEFDGDVLLINQSLIDRFPSIFFENASFGFATGVANTQANQANGSAPQIIRTNPIVQKKFPYGFLVSDINVVPAAPDQLHLSPILEDITFTLPATRYTSSELAQRITQEASKINQAGDIDKEIFTSTNSPVYRTIQDELRLLNPTFTPQADDATAHALLTNGKIVFVETDIPEGQTHRNTFRLNSYKLTDRNYMVGSAGGFTLEYNDVADKFSIQNIHSPLRDQNPNSNSIGAPQIRGYVQPNSNDEATNVGSNRKFYVNKYSGIYIANLSPKNVWKTQMKFDNLIIPDDKNTTTKYRIGVPPGGPRPELREEYTMDSDKIVILDGVNATGSYESTGTAEQHGIATTENPVTGGGAAAGAKRIPAGSSTFDTIISFLPSTQIDQNDATEVLLPVPYIATNTDQVFNIFSNAQVEDGTHDIADEGYYKIVVDSKISNELVGADQTIRNVSAIISKYNSYGNFTAAYNEGSVSYIHKGQPLTITDFRVKILLPSGELATDINNRNTVFLELTKNQ